MAEDAVFCRGIGLEKLLNGSIYARGLGRGDDDVGAVFEGGFGDGVAYPAGAADDEDASVVQLGGVFFRVGHCEKRDCEWNWSRCNCR